MERHQTDIYIGTKIIYTEGHCRYVLFQNNETEETECYAVQHEDSPLLAPTIIPDPHFNGFSWDFSKITVLDDNDLDIFIANVNELREFLKQVKDIRK